MRLLAVLLTLAVLGAACGGSSKSSTATATTASGATTATTGAVATTTATSATTAAGVVISSVVWSGGETSPAITISGSGFGSRPAPNPNGAPSTLGSPNPRLQCVPESGDEGLNFGTDLYVFTSDNAFAAGRYRPEALENDCVGFVVDDYEATRIKVHFGSAYPAMRDRYNYTVRNGYHYEIGVKGTQTTGLVQYT